MTPRYRTRIQATFPVTITLVSQASEGRILDLTVPGCLIESPLVIKKGDYVQLNMLLPGSTSPCSVALAAVRWTKGSQFGVEFIKMNEKAQRQLHHVIARHLSHRVLTHDGNRHQFCEPSGQNWHLDTYSLVERTKRGTCIP